MMGGQAKFTFKMKISLICVPLQAGSTVSTQKFATCGRLRNSSKAGMLILSQMRLACSEICSPQVRVKFLTCVLSPALGPNIDFLYLIAFLCQISLFTIKYQATGICSHLVVPQFIEQA